MPMDEELQYLLEHDMIDLSHIRQEIEMNRRKEYLEKYLAFGKIWQGKNGRWYCYTYGEDKKRSSHSRKTRSDIEDYVIWYMKDNEDNPTVKEMFDEWNDRKLELEKISNPTHYRNMTCFRRCFGSIAKRKVRTIQPEEVEDFLERIIPEFDMTAKAFATVKCIVRGVFKRARKQKLITWSVETMLADMDISDRQFRKVYHEDDEQVFDEAETDLIIGYMEKHPDTLNLGILLLFATGLRVGELSALKPEDIGMDYVNVRRSETRLFREKGFEYTVKDFPKTAAGWRTVVVPQCWEPLMKKLKVQNPWGEWLFEKDGKRISAKAFSSRLWRLCETLHIKRKSPHKIRKTYATILLDASVDQNLIMQQMGHTSIITTERHYHRNRKTIEAKKEILNAVNFV